MGLFDGAVAYSAIADDRGLADRSSLFVDIAGDPAIAGRAAIAKAYDEVARGARPADVVAILDSPHLE